MKPVGDLSIDDLIAERNSLGDQARQLGSRVAAMNSRMGLINKELTRRQAKSTRPEISDHAVLRYLERARGMDVNAVRAEMEALIKTAENDKLQNGRGAFRNGDLLFLRRDRRVQTVFKVNESGEAE